MLLYPVARRPTVPSELCRLQPWAPPPNQEAFARYVARPYYNPTSTQEIQKLEEDDWSGGSSPERDCNASVCGWRDCGARVDSLSAHVARTHAHPHTDGLYYCGWNDCARPHRGFNARYKMLVHVRTHTNERPHTCNQCEKSFSRAENLKIHLRSHSGEKPYACPYPGCNKAYSNSSDRFKHTRTHTVDKPYCCKVAGCNKRYTDPSSLRKHVKTYKHYAPKTDHEDVTKSPVHELEGVRLTAQSDFKHTSQITPILAPISHYACITNDRKTHVPLERYSPVMTAGYILPEQSLYRVPTSEMSYSEYTNMYEHAYRNYYSNVSYPIVREEKIYTYSSPAYESTMEIDVESTDEPTYCNLEEEMPLNLKCTSSFNPVEDILRRSDLPLDLSTKS